MSILEGKRKLDLDENICYENPKYTVDSDKTTETKNSLNKYGAILLLLYLKNSLKGDSTISK
ncbi:hypothetical protein J1C67_08005 [Clostridium gasigenes]|uniref:hypothetical protein n=1 Tax=Clostridium gasigenes TaxID=94869 RepID=UPI0014385494|nr:hypothetical protein [Clostridium gasigenes]NKF06615.1 hypothetical protein [Clostridium gasigenes]QSW21033.1 hypothetical protein J1C67_08005 [Clostridium gasigenes]